MLRVNIVAFRNQAGLKRDVSLLTRALEEKGHDVSITWTGLKRLDGAWCARWKRFKKRCFKLLCGSETRFEFDVNVVLEHARPAHFGLAQYNVFIPNQEWFSRHDFKWLYRFDAVFTKTKMAEELFLKWKVPVYRVGFSATDCYNETIPRVCEFVHIAGSSPLKGTKRLLEIWRKHPRWPMLRVFQSRIHDGNEEITRCANIEHHVGFIEDEKEIKHLQNAHIFHLCLSETEGWGHYIVEAMSCCAVVITCDAPPMNELVKPNRGLLVKAMPTENLNEAMCYTFDENSLAEVVKHASNLGEPECEAIGAKAREWFLKIDQSLSNNLDDALMSLTKWK